MPENCSTPAGHPVAFPPARTLERAIGPVIARQPELQTRRCLGLIRAQLIDAFGKAVDHPDYQPTDDRYEKESRHFGFRTQERKMESMCGTVMNDCTLGANYIRDKRGPDALAGYLRTGIQTLLSAGKKIRTEVEQRRRQFQRANRVLHEDVEESPRQIFISGTVYDLLHEDRVGPLTTVQGMEYWRRTFEECERHLQFADSRGATREECARQADRSELRRYCDMLREQNVFECLGLSEAALFAQVFCAVHGTKPSHLLTIPKALYPRFEESFGIGFYDGRDERRHKELALTPVAATALERACGQLFPEDMFALRLLQRSCRSITSIINDNLSEGMIDEDVDSTLRLKRLFPHPAIQAEVCRRAPRNDIDDIRRSQRRDGDEAEEGDRPKDSLSLNAADILRLRDPALRKLARTYPNGLEWHTLLLAEDPARVEDIIDRLFQVTDRDARAVASELLALHLSMELGEAATSVTLGDALGTSSEAFQALRRTNARLAEFIEKRLTSPARTYCIDHLENQLCSADPLEQRFSALPVATAVSALDASTDHPPIFSPQYWHPLFRRHRGTGDRTPQEEERFAALATGAAGRGPSLGFWVGEAIRDAPTKHVRQTMDYVIKHHLKDADAATWIEFLMMLEDDAMRYIPLLIPSIPSAIAPEVTATIVLSRHSEEVSESLGTAIIDLPLGFLCSPSGELNVRKPWKHAAKLLDVLDRTQLTETVRFMREHAEIPYTHLCPNIYTIRSGEMREESEAQDIMRVFTSQSAILEADLPLIRAICKVENHGFERIILEKARDSTPEVRREITALLGTQGSTQHD